MRSVSYISPSSARVSSAAQPFSVIWISRAFQRDWTNFGAPVFWGSMAYTLIGGTAVGTVLILLFLPALYAAWFRVKPTTDVLRGKSDDAPELRTAMAAE